MKKILSFLLIISSISVSCLAAPVAPQIISPSAVLMEKSTGEILFEKLGLTAKELPLVKKKMIAALEAKEHHCEFEGVETVLTENGRYCAAPVSHKATLGEQGNHCINQIQQGTLLLVKIPVGNHAVENAFAQGQEAMYIYPVVHGVQRRALGANTQEQGADNKAKQCQLGFAIYPGNARKLGINRQSFHRRSFH